MFIVLIVYSGESLYIAGESAMKTLKDYLTYITCMKGIFIFGIIWVTYGNMVVAP